jgi:hypothetical protein
MTFNATRKRKNDVTNAVGLQEAYSFVDGNNTVHSFF